MSDPKRTERPASLPGPGPGRGPGMMGVGMPGEKPKNARGALGRLLSSLAPHTPALVLVLAATVVGALFGILAPRLMGDAITRLFEGLSSKGAGGGIDFAFLGQTIAWLAGLYLVSSAFTFLQQWVMAGISQKTVFGLRQAVGEKLARLPLKFYDGRSHGDVLSRMTNDVDNISNTLQQSLGQAISTVVSIAGTLVMMLLISPLLTVIGLVTLPLMISVTRVVAGRSKKHFVGQQKSVGELSGHVEEMYSGHRIVKAFGKEREALATFDGINARLYDAGWRAQFISGLIMPVMSFINNLGYVAVSVAGGLLAAAKVLPVGDILAFIQYLRQFTMPIVQLANIANVIQSTLASAERVFELLDEAEETPDPSDAKTVAEAAGEVVIRNLKFRYKPDTPLLEDLSLSVKPGQVVAIVGPTGAGKTTLVNLLMRFYELDEGSITLDGVDLRAMPRGHLRSHFGMVLQDTWLFQGTVRENIAFGREGASEADVVEAARAAHADHFIRTLPQGYDTVLNEEATNLSQGQKQLLTIARALLANPAVLILDEATSSVDTRTERAIQNAMHHLMQSRTSFVIAHRLSTIRDADVILVMHEGRVVEAGSHDQLLSRRGFYYDLYQSQFAGRAS